MAPVLVDVAGESDVGLVRGRNEDVLLVGDLSSGELHNQGTHSFRLGPRGLLLSVFDGMGGAMAGDRASALASEILSREVMRAAPGTRQELANTLALALIKANQRIRREGRRNPQCRGMGTTATAAGLIDETLVLAHVGDSRAYVVRDGALVQVTEDQSLLRELVASGQMAAEDAASYEHSNVILQALGVTVLLNPYFAEVPLLPRDLVLLCTDGLTAQVPEEEIGRALAGCDGDLAAAASTLTELARAYGGYDNTTVLLASFQGGEKPEPGRGGAAAERSPESGAAEEGEPAPGAGAAQEGEAAPEVAGEVESEAPEASGEQAPGEAKEPPAEAVEDVAPPGPGSQVEVRPLEPAAMIQIRRRRALREVASLVGLLLLLVGALVGLVTLIAS